MVLGRNEGRPDGFGGLPAQHKTSTFQGADGDQRQGTSACNNSRPNSNLHDGTAAPMAGPGAAAGDGSSRAASQVRQSAHFAGSGANSLNSKNSKTSAPSVHDVNL